MERFRIRYMAVGEVIILAENYDDVKEKFKAQAKNPSQEMIDNLRRPFGITNIQSEEVWNRIKIEDEEVIKKRRESFDKRMDEFIKRSKRGD